MTLEFFAGHGNPARSIFSRTVNNVVVFKIPLHTAHQQFPSRVIVRAADGHVISNGGGLYQHAGRLRVIFGDRRTTDA